MLDVGGGAGHQSFPLAQAGYDVTLLDSSPTMLDKARLRLARLPGEAQRRVTLLQSDGENADEATGGQRFAAVLCHGVLGYLEQPEPLVNQLCRCAAAGGIVSIMTGNAKTGAVRPALERRWDDVLASFDARTEIGVLGVPGRADTVEELSEGEVRQSVNTAEMLVPVPAIVAYASTIMTLNPGDVIFTGAPAGVGPIAAGEKLEVSIGRIGAMTVTVR